MTKKTIYTDGACSGNPGPGGWAWAIEGGGYKSGPDRATTNQRMELMAVLDAVRSNEGQLEIVSDSAYVVNCFRDKWYAGWLKRGWVNSKNQPVANRDIWEPLIENVTARKNVSFRWVKGHSGHPMNDLVDRLAVEAAQSGAGKSSAAEAEPQDQTTPTARKKTVPSSSGATSARFVVVFRAKLNAALLTPALNTSYRTTADRMRKLALLQFGCTEFQALNEGEYEVALSYWQDEAQIVRWKEHAEHVLAQELGRSSFYESYSVDVARVQRSYSWPIDA